MLHLITGGSASGKSLYGEKMALEAKGRFLWYLATMQPWGEEGQARVEKHRRQRAGKGFHTVEAYFSRDMAKLLPEFREDRVILLECMSNLVANELFEGGGRDEEIRGRIRSGISHLQDCAREVIVITNEVFSDGISYEKETMRYIRLLGEVNQELAELADQVTEVVYGIALKVKPGRRDSSGGRQEEGEVVQTRRERRDSCESRQEEGEVVQTRKERKDSWVDQGERKDSSGGEAGEEEKGGK